MPTRHITQGDVDATAENGNAETQLQNIASLLVEMRNLMISGMQAAAALSALSEAVVATDFGGEVEVEFEEGDDVAAKILSAAACGDDFDDDDDAGLSLADEIERLAFSKTIDDQRGE